MNEIEWAANISERLNEHFSKRTPELSRLHSGCNQWLPYRFEIFDYSDGDGIKGHSTPYKTDILIWDRVSDTTRVPRVVIETKLRISTQDALTYSAKAETHKQVHPYLRYGLLMGGAEHTVPVRLFRHGAFFDFMATWKSQEPSKGEFQRLVGILEEEVTISRTIEGFVGPKGSKTKKRYSVIRRKLSFEE